MGQICQTDTVHNDTQTHKVQLLNAGMGAPWAVENNYNI